MRKYFAAVDSVDPAEWIKDRIVCLNHQTQHVLLTTLIVEPMMAWVSSLFSLISYLCMGCYLMRCQLSLAKYLMNPGSRLCYSTTFSTYCDSSRLFYRFQMWSRNQCSRDATPPRYPGDPRAPMECQTDTTGTPTGTPQGSQQDTNGTPTGPPNGTQTGPNRKPKRDPTRTQNGLNGRGPKGIPKTTPVKQGTSFVLCWPLPGSPVPRSSWHSRRATSHTCLHQTRSSTVLLHS
jgi:hypothetical protein